MNSYGADFTSMYFLDQSTGYATSNENYYALYKTTNGGVNWITNYYPYCKSVKYLNSTFGYCLSKHWGTYYTDNYDGILIMSGSSWNSYLIYYSNSNPNNAHLNSVHFITSTIGYTAGDSGKIYKTLNGGSNWSSQNSNTVNKLKSIKALDINKVITAGNNGTIKATTDGGLTWYTQNSTTYNNLNSVYMVNPSTGFIAGDVGTILKTTNGGVWIRKIDEIVPSNYELYQNYPNPFNPSTTIRFSIPTQEFVKLTVYDINGKLIQKLVSNTLSKGIYETIFEASNLNSGIYIIRLESTKATITKKITFVK